MFKKNEAFFEKNDLTDSFPKITEMTSVGIMNGYFKDRFELCYADDKMCRMLNYSSCEEFLKAIHNNMDNSIYYEDLSRLKGEFGSISNVGEEFSVIYRMLRKNGSLIWVLYKGRKQKCKDGGLAICGLCTDITDITERQSQLKEFAKTLKGSNS